MGCVVAASSGLCLALRANFCFVGFLCASVCFALERVVGLALCLLEGCLIEICLASSVLLLEVVVVEDE